MDVYGWRRALLTLDYSIPGEPVKLTKTAQRKAAKAARLAKKQDRARSKQSTPDPSSSAAGTPATAASLPLPDANTAPSSLADSGVIVEPKPAKPPPTETVVQEPVKLVEPTINGEPTTSLEEHPLPPPVSIPLVFTAPSAPAEEPAVRKYMPIVKLAEKLPVNGHAVNGDAAPSVPPAKADEKPKKKTDVVERTVFSLLMIGGFISTCGLLILAQCTDLHVALLLMGHAYMIMLVLFCQTLVYREVTALFSIRKRSTTEEEMTRDPWSKTLNWYFFAVTNYFLYGESIIYYFKV